MVFWVVVFFISSHQIPDLRRVAEGGKYVGGGRAKWGNVGDMAFCEEGEELLVLCLCLCLFLCLCLC